MQQQVGPYRVTEILGEGGMAIVYLAEQDEPVQRRVALKMIKPGMDTAQVLARFESERQALAVLDHPFISRVFDAGVTDAGRPYFVMEYVDGISITEYCDQHRLDISERISLFGDVCAAVQHAHQKSVIHRDIKPSNILVVDHKGAPLPKVIDFGIAKAINIDLTDKTLETRIGHAVGTPQYMSPEQSATIKSDIDTRSDVYSLGVVLYELLTGALPLALEELPAFAAGHAIREVEPPVPSARFGRASSDTQAAGDSRNTDTQGMKRQLRGDLDWIVMKAIAKDREQRYQTVNALQADLDRFLAGLPVMARPPSAGYLVRRFISRNKVAVTAGTLAVIALLGGTTIASIGFIRASTEAESANQVSNFLVELFQISDPGESRGNTVTAREMLDKAVVRIDEELSDEPAIRSRLMSTMAGVYVSLGLFQEALPLAEQSLAIRRELDRGSIDVADDLDQLAGIHRSLGDVDKADPLNIAALDIRRGMNGEGDISLVPSLEQIAVNFYVRGDYEQSAVYFDQALQILDSNPGSRRAQRAELNSNLGVLADELGDFPKARAYQESALELYKAEYGDVHPTVATVTSNYAIALKNAGLFDEAEPAYREALRTYRALYGDSHHLIANVLNNLSVLLLEMSRLEEAYEAGQQSLEMVGDVFGRDHHQYARVKSNLGRVLVAKGRYEEAEVLFTETLALRVQTLDPGHWEFVTNLTSLAIVHDNLGNPEQALDYARQASERAMEILDAGHWRRARAESVLGSVMSKRGDFAGAEPLLLASYEDLKKGRGEDNSMTREALDWIVDMYERWQKPDKAAEWREKRVTPES